MEDLFKKLLEIDVYSPLEDKRNKLFLEAVNQNFQHHFLNCEPYNKFCQRRGFNQDSVFTCLEDMPALPVQAFKEFGNFLISSANDKRSNLILQSSATSGKPSSVSIDKITARRQVQTMSRVLLKFLGDKKRPFIVVDIDPRSISSEVMGARVAATNGFLNLSNNQTYILKENKDGALEVDKDKLIEALEACSKSKEDPVIFGFTYVLFESILQNAELINEYNLGSNASLIHIGGWKKLENKKVSKDHFNDMASKTFGIKKDNVIDIYGFTEQMGIIYPSRGINQKTTSVFGDVLVRDPSTYEVLPNGEEGLLQFISPMPFSYPGHSIITDDLGVISCYSNEDTNNIFGKKFEITGRAKNAEARGCGDIMSTYVKVDTKIKEDFSESKPGLLFKGTPAIDPKFFLHSLDVKKLPEVDNFVELRNDLMQAQSKLEKYSIDELISYLSEISKTWLHEDSELKIFQQQGLSFLSNWLESSNLRAMADQALNGQRGISDSFAVDKFNEYRKIRAVPRGMVVHWLAGNVPLLGMLALAQAIVTKNANILKVPSKNSGVLPLMLNTMTKYNLTLPTGKVIKGRDITDTIALVYFEKDNKIAAENLSKISDIRIAWGGQEAIESVLSLPKKHTAEDVIFGPKLSYMAIGKESLNKETNLQKLFRRVATDCSVFDQYACASPHTIFVERGGELSPKEFAENLAEHMEKAASRIPKEPADAGTAGNINSIRMLYEFTETLWTSDDTSWSVLFDEKGQDGLVNPTYSRVITVRAINDIYEAAAFASHDIQTIGLSLAPKRKYHFAEIASKNGACRFPDIGRMTHFDSPWDGMFLINRLIKFISLEGPFN